MNDDDLNLMLTERFPGISRQSENAWSLSFGPNELSLVHSAEKQDLVFTLSFPQNIKNESREFYISLMKFSPQLLNGAFALDDEMNLVFMDRIPTFHLDWREVKRTVATAEIVNSNIETYISRARGSG